MISSSEDMRDYFVVEFPDEADGDSIPLAVVPSIWVSLKQNICFWPKLRTEEERRRAVIKKIQFERESCKACSIVVKFRTNSYEKAASKLKFIETAETSSFTSHSEDDGKIKRKSRPNSTFKDYYLVHKNKEYSQATIVGKNQISSASSDEDDLPPLSPPHQSVSKKINRSIIESDEGSDLDETLKVHNTEKHLNKTETAQFTNILCSKCKNTEAKMDMVIRKIDLLAHDVKFLLGIVQRTAISEVVDMPENLVLPLEEEQKLSEFEEKLGSDEDFFSNVVTSLMSVGGKDVADGTRRIMTKLLSHNLSLQFNWTGRGKKEFMKLKNILRLILVCLRKNPITRKATEQEVSTVIKVWLRTATDRQGGRNRRRKQEEV